MEYAQKARELFLSGYTCCQAVLLAFEDVTGLPRQTAVKLASSFGGGMGGLRQVCGTVSAMFMIAGLVYGFDAPGDITVKTEHYRRIRDLADRFITRHNTLICKELLADLPGTLKADPSKRDAAYYKVRPCTLLVEDAANILADYLVENPVSD